MLDLKLLRSDPERVKAALARRGAGGEVDELLNLDGRRRELLPQVEDAQAERNAASKRIGEIKREGGDADAEIAAVGRLRETIDAGKEELEALQLALRDMTLALPNIPDNDAPDGIADEDAVVIKEVGELPKFDFEPRDHLTIGTELGLIDVVMISNLLVMVIVGGYETFVSRLRLEGHPDHPVPHPPLPVPADPAAAAVVVPLGAVPA